MLFLGLLGLILIFLTTEIYHKRVLETENQNLISLINIETDVVRKKHEEITQELANNILKAPSFKKAVLEGDRENIKRILNDQFHQYYVAADVVQLSHIMVLDKDYRMITASSHHNELMRHDHCPAFLVQNRQRKGIEALRSSTALCSHHGMPTHLALYPIGTFNNPGYLYLITDISRDYQALEASLGVPIKTLSNMDNVFYTSKSWPSLDKIKNMLVVEYTIKDIAGDVMIKLRAVRDYSSLSENLNNLRFFALLFSALITLIAVMLVLFFVTRSALIPLSKLNAHLRSVQNDRSRLGEQIELIANPEITELADNYNSLSKELKKAYNSLERMAYTDPLTTLPNRSQLQRQLDYHASQTQERDLHFALFLMDLDRFKQVNDTLGHHAGDILLQEVGKRINNVLRKTDIVTRIDEWGIANSGHSDVARLGGDEFAAVLPSVGNISDAINVAQKIQSEMNAPFKLDNHEFSVGISIGIVLAPLHGIDPTMLMRKADVAMYHAKNHQLGYFIYDQQKDTHSVEILKLDSDLRNAIQKNEFVLYYQPKIDIAQNLIVGVEALIRWQKEKDRIIFPDQFIPHSEQTGLIHEITEWVINDAVKTQKDWQDRNLDLSIAINLSSKSLHNKEVSKHILNRIRQTQISPGKIYLEITESSLMADPKRSANILRQITEQGIKVSIDDFGTGYSSLSKLKNLPVDEIKIDRSFVMDMMKDNNDRIIVQTIVDLAHNMNMTVTAEGVEDQSILNTLKNLGCECAQGYHMGKPMPKEQFDLWLKESEWGIKS